MIKNNQGLKTNFEFNVTRKYGKYFYGKYFHMYILQPINYTGISKLGVVVSAKFDKKAVVRNRVKRLFKIAFTDYLTFTKDLWIVVHPKTNSKLLTSQQIIDDVNKTLSFINLKNIKK